MATYSVDKLFSVSKKGTATVESKGTNPTIDFKSKKEVIAYGTSVGVEVDPKLKLVEMKELFNV